MKEAFSGWLTLVLGPSAYALIRWELRSAKRETPGRSVAGAIDDFAPGSSKTISVGEEKVIVVRATDGRFRAVSGVCTHLGCSIRYSKTGNAEVLACNCHSSQFDLDGMNLSGPAPSPLRRFNVGVVGDEVVVSSEAARIAGP